MFVLDGLIETPKRQFSVIPDLIRNPGFPVKTGTQFLMFLVPCFRRDDVWIPLPAGRQAFPRLRAEALRRASTGMTTFTKLSILNTSGKRRNRP